MKRDILERKDIEKLVNEFYKKVFDDELLAPVFSQVDWPHHAPIMYNFWSSLLLGDKSYEGNPFQKHVKLPIGVLHFQRWLYLFSTTVDEIFEGDTANEAKARAESIAGIFQHKLGLKA
jgi:hemoglobin